MGQSGNPAKRAEKKPTAKKAASKKASEPRVGSVSDFKALKKGRPVRLPSGIWVKARRVELRSFLQGGDDVPNPLLSVVEEAINKGQGIDMAEVTGFGDGEVNLETINEMLGMVDRVVISVLVEPRAYEVPEDEDDRDDDLLYVDELDDEDKMFLFQWASGGTDDVATFRAEAEESLVSLAESKSTKPVAKRAARAGAR